MRQAVILKAVAAVSVGLMLASCASKVKRVELPDSANVNQELSTLEHDIQAAAAEQIDVTAPENFSAASKEFDKAKREIGRKNSTRKILDTIGEGKAYLNRAREQSAVTAPQVTEILGARLNASKANARGLTPKEFGKVDDRLRKFTSRAERGKALDLSQKEREYLFNEYGHLEVDAIRTTNLSAASSRIDEAVKNGAAKVAPKSLARTRALFKQAETVISADRHNQEAITVAVNEANLAADRLVKITERAKSAKGKSPEEIAMLEEQLDRELRNKEAALIATSSQLEQYQQQSSEAQEQSQQQLSEAEQRAQEAERQMRERERHNRIFQEAQNAFDARDAEVMRQGDQLIVRLKALHFKPGQSSLGPENFQLLGRVRDVIEMMNAQHVTIAGNTDSSGKKATNKKLSEERAQAVAQYLVSTDAIQGDQIEIVGNGDDRPIAPNKTKEGRAQNRRVDVIITPSSSIQ